MKYGYAGIAMIAFGLVGLVTIVMFEFVTVDNESEYYSLKEAMKAAMIESIDLACYRNNNCSVDNNIKRSSNGAGTEGIQYSNTQSLKCGCNGELKISEQKFVENFTKRFAASVNGNVDDYTIEFYDIIESPPKASIRIMSRNSSYRGFFSAFNGKAKDENDIYISNDLTGILETIQ